MNTAFLRVLFLSLVAECLIGLPVLAQDNPFGLPQPKDPQKVGSVMLHGGGNGVRGYVREEFLKLAGGSDARVVLIPSDYEERNQGESLEAYNARLSGPKSYGRWVELCRENHAQFQFLHWNCPEDPDHAKFFAALDAATGIWMPANDQEWVIRQFAGEPLAPTKFQIALRNLLARGGVVGASGGGMASLAETVIAGNADNDDGGWTQARLIFGLGLFHGTLLDQNFDIWAGRVERLTDTLLKGPTLDRAEEKPGIVRRSIGIGIDRQTVAIVKGNSIRVIGEGHVHLLVQSNGGRTIAWHRLSVGDKPLVLNAAPVRAKDWKEAKSDRKNPFGSPSDKGAVVLHGGKATSEMYEYFPRLSGKVQPKLVHCPSASNRFCNLSDEKLMSSRLADFWKTDAVASLRFVNAQRPEQAEDPDFCKILDDADALWFMGGDQENLTALYVDPKRPTLFQKKVRAIVERGGVVGGTSAGCAAMSDVMIGGDAPNDGRHPVKPLLSRGLGVLSNVVAEQHFDARHGRIERFSDLLRNTEQLAKASPGCNPERMIGMAVEEGAALIVHGNRLSVAGKNKAHVFLKSTAYDTLTWHTLAPGDDAVVLTAPDGTHELHFEEWTISD